MFTKKKKIIDERQELQSLKNVKMCWTIMILLLGLSVCVQSSIFNLSPVHYIPETMILLIGCILNIFLDVRQGNLYTKDTQNTKFCVLLYIISALVVALLTGIGNYLKYDFPPMYILVVTIPMFVFTLGLMFLCDFFYRKLAKRRINKFNKKSEIDENL